MATQKDGFLFGYQRTEQGDNYIAQANFPESPELLFIIEQNLFNNEKFRHGRDASGFIVDPELAASTGLNFHGQPYFLFGEFTENPRNADRYNHGTFRVLDAYDAPHLFMKVCWDTFTGLYSHHDRHAFGITELSLRKLALPPLYGKHVAFRHANYRAGCDFLIVPVGYYQAVEAELDSIYRPANDADREEARRAKFAEKAYPFRIKYSIKTTGTIRPAFAI